MTQGAFWSEWIEESSLSSAGVALAVLLVGGSLLGIAVCLFLKAIRKSRPATRSDGLEVNALPAVEEVEHGITARPPPALASLPGAEPDEPSRMTVPRRSRTMFWVLLGSAIGCFSLVAVGGTIAVVAWLLWPASPAPVASNAPPPMAPGPLMPRQPGQPATAAGWFMQGNLHMGLEDLDGAIAAFTRAIELDPRLAAAYINRGLARSNN